MTDVAELMSNPPNCPGDCLVFARCWPAAYSWAKFLLGALDDPLSNIDPATRVSYALTILVFATASNECEKTRDTYLANADTMDFFIDFWATKSHLREVRQFAARSLRVTLKDTLTDEHFGDWFDALRARLQSVNAIVGCAASRAHTALFDFAGYTEADAHVSVLFMLVYTRERRPEFAFAIQSRILRTMLRVFRSSPMFDRTDCAVLASNCISLLLRIFMNTRFVEIAFRNGLVGPLARAGRLLDNRELDIVNAVDKERMISWTKCMVLGAVHRLDCFRAARRDFTRFTQDIGSFSTPLGHATIRRIMDELEAVLLEHTVLRYLHRRGIGVVEEYCSQASYCRSSVCRH